METLDVKKLVCRCHAGYQVLLIALVVLFAAPTSVLAHGGHGPTNIQTFTQAIGPYELAVTVEIPPSVPAPLYLTIDPQSDVTDAKMDFRAVPRGQSFDGAPVAEVMGLPGPQGAYLSELPVDRYGDWDMEVRISGPKGSGTARIPFTITVQPLPVGSIGLFAALGGLVVLMITSIALAATYQRKGRPAPGWANWLIGQAMFACLIVAVIFGIQQFSAAIQSASAQAAAAQGTLSSTATAFGRPHVNMALHITPTSGASAPTAGQSLTLTLDLSDGSTGLPVEDIIPHHEALVHLVVISADSGYFNHIHPARTAPGRYAIALTPDRPGSYTAYAEIQRQDSGTQVIDRSFEVGGTANNSPPPSTEGLGQRAVADMQVDVTASVASFTAGKQATFTFSFSKDGKPVADLQPWLGMGGHMIARSVDQATFAHVHAQGVMAPSGILASGIVYGPEIRFVYTFPQPGRYQIWGQFKRAGQIVTVPLAVKVQ
ncbi:hypothetical protein SE17_01990 [Kouleothrix aurantiaca]|uniref:YtkA-like domain-containing protein n=1 Tax=Kouleothrix aurantiaca TaxID=186479 RepID=A0A0P9DXP5_9CHLR|nr:hypothetical protein SE17_01990 [Kouleothrix aurantiaca]